MSGDVVYGVCDYCGKESTLTRVTERFCFPCECHSPEHFITHDLCSDCLQEYHMEPDTECTATISVDTFNTFLKAHTKYNMKYQHRFTCDDINPEYMTEDNKPVIKIRCTYEMMCYLGKIYAKYQYEKYLEAEEDSDD